MCGRYALYESEAVLAGLFDLPADKVRLQRRFNIAPTQTAVIVAEDGEGRRRLTLARWGLIPHWAKASSIGGRMINARSESVADKPAFAEAFRRRRCLVPASGFYEWHRSADGGKQPYYIRSANESPLILAGLWERWRDPTGTGDLLSFTILTTAANATIAGLHDRMPVILTPESTGPWLAESTSPALLGPLLRPASEDLLIKYPVSRRVNSPAQDHFSMIERVSSLQRPMGDGSTAGLRQPRLFD